MGRKKVKTTNLLGAVPQAVQFVTNHSDLLAAKGVKPDEIKTLLDTCCTAVQATEQAQADAKTALRNATQAHYDTVAARYPEFSSVIDLLRGTVGNRTPLGQQLTNIRKQALGSTGRSSGDVIDVNTSAKKVA